MQLKYFKNFEARMLIVSNFQKYYFKEMIKHISSRASNHVHFMRNLSESYFIQILKNFKCFNVLPKHKIIELEENTSADFWIAFVWFLKNNLGSCSLFMCNSSAIWSTFFRTWLSIQLLNPPVANSPPSMSIWKGAFFQFRKGIIKYFSKI